MFLVVVSEYLMQYTTLGKTDLEVSVMALGAGGPSRLGQLRGSPRSDSVRVVQEALDLGVNLIDTAQVYGTEEIVADGIAGRPRDSVYLSTKKQPYFGDKLVSPDQMTVALEESLHRLRTDYVDIFHLHGLVPDHYVYARDELVPRLEQLRSQGKIRFIGVTERFNQDLEHSTVRRAIEDRWAHVVMVGFNMINQSARRWVFPLTRSQGVGVMVMVPVRRALSNPEHLSEVVASLVASGEISPGDAAESGTLQFLVHEGGAASLPDAAYRYCRHEPGCDVVVSGTGNVEHLRQNYRSLHSPPLSDEDLNRVNGLFARVRTVSPT